MAQQSTILKIIPMICWEENRFFIKIILTHKKKSVFNSSQILTHHYSSDADAHVPNDVEFTVEELLDACLTVLHTKDKRSQAVSS